MTSDSSSSFIRTLLVYSICVPLAVFLGYLLAQPLDYSTIISLALVLFILTIPLLLRWHHLLLIASLNLGAVIVFAPGRPWLWLAMAWLSLGISVVQYIIHPRLKFLRAPTVTRPLLLLALVTLVTAVFRGGIKLGSMGGGVEEGGSKYIYLLSGIVAYFALIAQRIPPKRAYLYAGLYFLGSLTCLIGELPAIVGPSFYFIFLVFPVSSSGAHAALEPGAETFRVMGFGAAGAAVILWMLCRHGIRELLSFRRPFRLVIFAGFGVLALFSGFRGFVVTFAIVFAIVFYLEGLMRSRLLPFVAVSLVTCGAVVAGFSDRMPSSIQRSLSFLPLKIDPVIKIEAQESTDWRIRIWRNVLPEVPQYLMLGKGYGISAKELARVESVGRTGESGSGAASELAGDYHSGPLSVIIPLGIPGALAFLWFLYAGARALYSNYRFGDPAYRRINTFLLAYFVTKVFAFFVLFGALSSDLVTFTGLIGLSISLNGGVLKSAVARQPKLRLQPLKFGPPLAKPVGVVPQAGGLTLTSTR